IHDSEAAYRKSVSDSFFTVEDALQYIAGLPVRDCSKAAFCASMVRTTLKCIHDECVHYAAGTYQSDNDVGDGRCLSIMLLEATATTCEVCASLSAVPQTTSNIEQCKIDAENLNKTLVEVLHVVRGRNLNEVKSLGDANTFSHLTNLLADAQLLLEAIDVHSLPDSSLYVKLLGNVENTLCDAVSTCIRKQCAGNPEYSVPTECDCANPNEWDFPSPRIESAYQSLVADSMGYIR
uniref:hypothetical protein n=1 Tax=Anaplasma phagocytophilum TaxID=948 RepID=UPI00201B18AF